jgi:hypothetical protein
MKLKLITLCFIAFNFVVVAQPDTLYQNKSFRIQGQVGINATDFIKNFIVLNSSTVNNVSPYAVNAKVLSGFRFAPAFLIGPRFGMGYVDDVSSSNNEAQDNERSDNLRQRNFRGGLEIQQLISKRFTLLYGVDYVYGTVFQSTVSTFLQPSPTFPFEPTKIRSESTVESKTTGGGLVLGVQFAINRYLVLSTETAFLRQETRSSNQTVSDNPNNTIRPIYGYAKNTRIALPFFINCNFVF